MPSRFLYTLKERTRSHHDQVEARVDLPRRLASLADYRGLIERFYGFYAPLEERLARQHPHLDGFDLALRAKTPLLAQDLRALGLSEEHRRGLPRCIDLPALESLPQALGCLYVLEGATLGGRLITRRLQQALNLSPARGGAFFASYGERVGEMWVAFRVRLAGHATTPETEEAIIASALDTFNALDRWLAEER